MEVRLSADTSMRFCMISTFYPPYHFGGDAIFVQSLSRALVAHGHQVEVVHCEDAYRLQASAAAAAANNPDAVSGSDGVLVHRLSSRYYSLSSIVTQQTSRPGFNAAALRRILDRPFDVVNFHNISLLGGLEILPLSSAPVNLYTLHEHWLLCPTHIFWKNRRRSCDSPQCIRCCLRSGIPPQFWRYSGLTKRSLRSVDALLSPSAYTARRHAEANLGRPIHVLPTFSPIDPGPALVRASATGRPRFVYVGRVTRSKGVDLLVAFFAKLPQFDLDIVGEGDLLDELRQNYAAYLSIRFLGLHEHSQVARFYSGATAMILPSLAPEVFPLCILEAFACGIPVIVNDAGGSREAVDRSGAGFVYQSDRELLDAIMMLASQPDLRAALVLRARDAYEQFYNEKRYVAEYLSLIDQIKSNATAQPQELNAALP
jgi:glycosyltransferase involved in cell wall biosynthesis